MHNIKLPLRKQILISSIAMTALATTACAPVKQAQQSFKDTFTSLDPCSNNARNIGVVAGGVVGGIIGHQIGDIGAPIGAIVGASIGGFIGHDMDNRRCELHKISQKYEIPIQSQPIELGEAGINPKNNKEYGEKDALGLKVNLQDTGKQFLTGSSKLTPKAEEYFTAIAASYSPAAGDAKDKKTNDIFAKRQILIIGHTDDVGNSNGNAVLAEKRAIEVAKIFEKQGINKSNIHYQGAGETQPIADNRTEEGRSKNRRAEIIDLPDQAALYAYLAHRKPVIAFYRTTTPLQRATTEKRDSPSDNVVVKAPSSKAMDKSYQNWTFGGQQLTSTNAVVSIGDLTPEKEKFAWASLVGISTAKADTYNVYESSCAYDRPRESKGVKSLATNKEITLKTQDYLPGLNNTVWMGIAGQHTVAITDVAVTRDGSIPTKNPEVYFYKANALSKSSKPDIKTIAHANAYHGKNGVLYRLFLTDKASPVQCMDIVMPHRAPFEAQSGYIIYPKNNGDYVATYKPNRL